MHPRVVMLSMKKTVRPHEPPERPRGYLRMLGQDLQRPQSFLAEFHLVLMKFNILARFNGKAKSFNKLLSFLNIALNVATAISHFL